MANAQPGGRLTHQALRGRRAMVCGSTQGIGKACAEALARMGAEMVLVARNEARLNEVREALPTSADQALTHRSVCVDFSDPLQVRDAVEGFVADRGPVDVLVNNTGGPMAGPIASATPEEFTTAFAQHLICNQLLVQVTVPGMRATGYGRIINIVSTSVKQPIRGLGVSNTIRGAVASWSKTLATELAPDGITVNNVLPGATATARLRTIVANRAVKTGSPEAEVEAQMRAEIPMGRFAEPEEIAAAAAFLASPGAGYITGVSLAVDGGRIGCL